MVERLAEDVAQQRLGAGVALAAGAARVVLDGAGGIGEVLEHDPQVAARGRACGCGVAAQLARRAAAAARTAWRPDRAASPSARIAGRDASANSAESSRKRLQLARAGAQVHEHRALLDGGLAERRHRRASAPAGSAAACGSSCRMSSRALGGRARGVARLLHEAPDVRGGCRRQLADARCRRRATRSRITGRGWRGRAAGARSGAARARRGGSPRSGPRAGRRGRRRTRSGSGGSARGRAGA